MFSPFLFAEAVVGRERLINLARLEEGRILTSERLLFKKMDIMLFTQLEISTFCEDNKYRSSELALWGTNKRMIGELHGDLLKDCRCCCCCSWRRGIWVTVFVDQLQQQEVRLRIPLRSCHLLKRTVQDVAATENWGEFYVDLQALYSIAFQSRLENPPNHSWSHKRRYRER